MHSNILNLFHLFEKFIKLRKVEIKCEKLKIETHIIRSKEGDHFIKSVLEIRIRLE